MKLKSIIITLLFSLTLALNLSANKKVIGKVAFMVGKVKVVKTDKTKVRARRNFKFYGGETVLTGRSGTMIIKLTNGSKIKVLPSSKLIVNKVRSDKKSNKYAFGVIRGGVSSRVNKLRRNQDYYKVYTPTSVAGVRGTEFLVSVGVNGKSTVLVKEGVISLEGDENKTSVKGGQQAKINLSEDVEKSSAPSTNLEKENKKFQKGNKKLEKPVKSLKLADDKLRLISVRNRRRVRELRNKKKLTEQEKNELEFLYQRSVNQGEAWYSLSARVFKKYRSHRLMGKKIRGRFYKVQKRINTINDQIKDMDQFIDQMSKEIDDFTEETGKDIDDMEKKFMGDD